MHWRYAIAGLAVLAAGAQQQQGVNFYSLDKEIALGDALARQADSQVTPLNDAAATAYVDRVTAALGRQIPDSKFTYRVTIIKENVGAEPRALPGGRIYLPVRLFADAQNESQFVGMLAHAMAHVADRDYTRLATRGDIAQIAMIPLQNMNGPTGYK